ncbi:hypothetical protein Mmc1_2978 [Magnetococcus marinus MC-1]|uniref:Lipoprotein n=1 Tax=Magnetococcus marinus (strain ATCC BAA-1437 / JCM 17883 / MC-1) TaxID=156889 RepID=A0LBX6_MAGMM|nr:CsgG/HfaB family protein [Magnetococcus marinus]ABK45469.1 hypothetical protein Mmc1_2978 [Magnetococcus marinus MC-1]
MKIKGWIKKGRSCLLLLLGTLLMVGCSMGTDRSFVLKDALPRQMTVAVLPFENLSNNPNGGLIVAQLLSTELYHRQIFQQMEETEMRRLLTQNKVDMDRLSDVSLARKVGLMLGVDAVILGSVSELSYQHGLREEPAVGFNVQLLRVADSKVVWRGSQSLMGSGWLRRESLIYTAQQAASQLVARMDHGYGADGSKTAPTAASATQPSGTTAALAPTAEAPATVPAHSEP